jgi:drug/metabolite transporter (DMT)-like permease
MAKALTLAFVAPLITTALSSVFLDEKVGIRR